MRTLIVMCAFLVAGCAGPTEVIPETGRERGELKYTEAEMSAIGAQAYGELIAEEEEVTEGEDARMVRRVARRLADVTGKDYAWEFKLLKDDDQVNAFCLPGGKIAVYTGILPICDGEDGLAVVLGHEIAHATLQHGNERLSETSVIGALLGLPVTFATDLWGAISPRSRKVAMDALGLGHVFGKLTPYSQVHEYEADEVGLRYLHGAGFRVDEAPKFWKRMAAAQGETTRDSLSSHPDPLDRSSRLEEMIKSKAYLPKAEKAKPE